MTAGAKVVASTRPPVAGGRGSRPLRFLDRTLAVALLRVIGGLRRRRELPADPERIGILKTTGIGDMVLATAIARDVMSAFPKASVTVFASSENAALARLVPGIEVVELPPAKPWAAIPILRRARLDALLDLGQWSRLEALYTVLSGARWTGGFATPRQRRHYAYDATAPHSPTARELDNYRAAAALLGVHSESDPVLDPPDESAPAPVAEPYVVFHLWPGGFRSELREWPAERWRELAERLTGEGSAVVLTGGPGDSERAAEFVRACAGLPREVVSVAGTCGLAELVALLRGAGCVVSVNTGVMHMAAAAGAPTVALNGPTSALRWGPVGPRTVCVDSELPGCGFLNLGFEYEGQREDCMAGISVDRVAAAALAFEGARG